MKPEDIERNQLAQLKEMAKIFLKPLEKMPFPVVVEAMTGCQLIPYVEEHDNGLLDALSKSCMQTVVNSESRPIQANRPNDVSAPVENILQENLIAAGIPTQKPKSKKTASHAPQGYPDLLLWDGERPAYLEVKVSRMENISKGSPRNFFYQPTARSKIAHDARHLLCGFAIAEKSEKKWVLKEWKITDLYFLRVKLKPEYNADNLEIYREQAVLIEGDGRKIKPRST